MVRAKYENQSDLANEQAGKAIIEEALDLVRLYKSPEEFSPFDFYLTDKEQNFKAIVEYKRRYYDFKSFPDSVMRIKKFKDNVSIAAFYKVDFLFIVEYNDGLYMYRYRYNDEDTFTIKKGGRDVRSGEVEREILIHIPHDRFIQIKKQ